MEIGDPKIVALRDKVTAAQQEFDMAVTFKFRPGRCGCSSGLGSGLSRGWRSVPSGTCSRVNCEMRLSRIGVPTGSQCFVRPGRSPRGVAASTQQFETRSATHTRLFEVLRTALQIAKKAVNTFADSIQRGAILIVCQSADAKYPQDCFLSASRFSAFLFDHNGVTGKSGSTGAT